MANKRVNDDGSMKAVIYARYSSENQREESIEGQMRECYAFAKKNGISVVGEYIDRAFSAKTDRRPDFQRMIKDSAKHNFNLVIVWKLDRFARNRYDSAHYKALLKKNGVKVMSAVSASPTAPKEFCWNRYSKAWRSTILPICLKRYCAGTPKMRSNASITVGQCRSDIMPIRNSIMSRTL